MMSASRTSDGTSGKGRSGSKWLSLFSWVVSSFGRQGVNNSPLLADFSCCQQFKGISVYEEAWMSTGELKGYPLPLKIWKRDPGKKLERVLKFILSKIIKFDQKNIFKITKNFVFPDFFLILGQIFRLIFSTCWLTKSVKKFGNFKDPT